MSSSAWALKQIVEAGPNPADGVVRWRWRLIDLAQWVYAEFGISISKQTLSRMLRGMGYRKLTARPRHHAQDPTALEAFNLTASIIWNLLRFVDRCVAARASREGPGEGNDEPSAQGCDRVRDVSFGSDRRRLWVENGREQQIPRRARRGLVLRGEGHRVRRSGSRRRRSRASRDGGNRASRALRHRQSHAPA
jgi:Winged helix-turn helix